MPYCCSVPLCRGNHYQGPKVSTFSFPEEPELCKAWVAATKIKKSLIKHSKVCHLHFKPNEIETETVHNHEGKTLSTPIKLLRLTTSAIPSIFPPSDEYTRALLQSTVCTNETLKFCAILECSNSTRNSPNLFFCRLTLNNLHFTSWLEKLGLKKYRHKIYICSQHLKLSHISHMREKQILPNVGPENLICNPSNSKGQENFPKIEKGSNPDQKETSSISKNQIFVPKCPPNSNSHPLSFHTVFMDNTLLETLLNKDIKESQSHACKRSLPNTFLDKDNFIIPQEVKLSHLLNAEVPPPLKKIKESLSSHLRKPVHITNMLSLICKCNGCHCNGCLCTCFSLESNQKKITSCCLYEECTKIHNPDIQSKNTSYFSRSPPLKKQMSSNEDSFSVYNFPAISSNQDLVGLENKPSSIPEDPTGNLNTLKREHTDNSCSPPPLSIVATFSLAPDQKYHYSGPEISIADRINLQHSTLLSLQNACETTKFHPFKNKEENVNEELPKATSPFDSMIVTSLNPDQDVEENKTEVDHIEHLSENALYEDSIKNNMSFSFMGSYGDLLLECEDESLSLVQLRKLCFALQNYNSIDKMLLELEAKEVQLTYSNEWSSSETTERQKSLHSSEEASLPSISSTKPSRAPSFLNRCVSLLPNPNDPYPPTTDSQILNFNMPSQGLKTYSRKLKPESTNNNSLKSEDPLEKNENEAGKILSLCIENHNTMPLSVHLPESSSSADTNQNENFAREIVTPKSAIVFQCASPIDKDTYILPTLDTSFYNQTPSTKPHSISIPSNIMEDPSVLAELSSTCDSTKLAKHSSLKKKAGKSLRKFLIDKHFLSQLSVQSKASMRKKLERTAIEKKIQLKRKDEEVESNEEVTYSSTGIIGKFDIEIDSDDKELSGEEKNLSDSTKKYFHNSDSTTLPDTHIKESMFMPLAVDDFLIKHLNAQTYGDKLEWVKKGSIFRVRTVHKNSNMWSPEDFKVFLDWDRAKGRKIPYERSRTSVEDDQMSYTASKQRFRAMLQKIKEVKEIKYWRDRNYRYYALDPCSSEIRCTRKRRLKKTYLSDNKNKLNEFLLKSGIDTNSCLECAKNEVLSLTPDDPVAPVEERIAKNDKRTKDFKISPSKGRTKEICSTNHVGT